jgi:hypothetical protein
MRRFLSLGAGVQSSTLLLMACRGDIEPFDAAIFSDTQSEPKAVYEWLGYLEAEASRVGIPLYRITAGALGDDVLHAKGKAGSVGQPPFFVRHPDNPRDLGGTLWRKCTTEYKVKPIMRAIRELLGVGPRSQIKEPVAQILGISRDEAHRCKPSRYRWIVNQFPLVDKRMSRGDCLYWLGSHGYPQPPKSACVFCPYRSNKGWLRLAQDAPDDFAQAVAFDHALRADGHRLPGVKGESFVHRSFRPLGVAIAEVAARAERASDQLDLWDLQDCEGGYCGV